MMDSMEEDLLPLRIHSKVSQTQQFSVSGDYILVKTELGI